MLIPFPNVPNQPGVPAIPRSPKFPTIPRIDLGSVAELLWRVIQAQASWGIFDAKGTPLGNPSQFTGLIGDLLQSSVLSTGSVDYSKETRVSDFPLERGGFASYNKVEMPAAPLVTLCLQGSEGDRRAFLEAVDKANKSTDLYSVVTPEITYINYSIERYNYSRRNSKGATLLIVEITLKEIRQVSALYTAKQIDEPKDAGATPQVDNGKVQAQRPQGSTLKGIAKKLPALADTVGEYFQGLVN
jgi:hypothetical protein